MAMLIEIIMTEFVFLYDTGIALQISEFFGSRISMGKRYMYKWKWERKEGKVEKISRWHRKSKRIMSVQIY